MSSEKQDNLLADFTPSAATLEQTKEKVHAKTNYNALPVRAYLDQTVVPILLQGLASVVRERPEDPIQYLASYLLRHNPNKKEEGDDDERDTNEKMD
ncbi:hypothetical protein FDP41_006733 [Naegleria fowleri]|uniref:Protein dpy-30 homolog n=1 Tax=Naegleria fowleri TaxID=5763 RepID=A0A6A5B6C2_NAEFO|nr:uncharacterized protein FDP41_007022 [Naegleria fowleri]XP_044558836.1 uncharacterized protein FDP41_006733 [Naegleria fowleri]KAF0973937.1 hypothetical protein FDP41_007022 [Naegleria fowleri]KAF0974123.1 hypothetical protein FDP41_006733 [Naegleria fowleri]CAG4707904.1 unnamed protein product [Naegleria fowleri]